MSVRHEVLESPTSVRVGEVVNWTMQITPWAASGTTPIVSAINLADNSDVTSTIFPVNNPTLVGTTYTLSPATGWTANTTIRVTAQFVSSGNTYRPYCDVQVVP